MEWMYAYAVLRQQLLSVIIRDGGGICAPFWPPPKGPASQSPTGARVRAHKYIRLSEARLTQHGGWTDRQTQIARRRRRGTHRCPSSGRSDSRERDPWFAFAVARVATEAASEARPTGRGVVGVLYGRVMRDEKKICNNKCGICGSALTAGRPLGRPLTEATKYKFAD